ncbi:hypothetical protein [Pseudomonas sp.]|uniref:hypothetical protein n=1 Tax=Pseudomonas sp. TaxID=306 RepID=UPI002639669D|nr:hypothetical protein [Pseudomonas sp.]
MSSEESVYRLAIAKSESADPGQRLIGWNAQWLMGGNLVICSTCFAHQPFEDAGRSFVHICGCIAADGKRFPWCELAEILSELPPLLN